MRTKKFTPKWCRRGTRVPCSLSIISISCFVTEDITKNSEHHTLGTQHRTMAPLLPLRLPASDGEVGTFPFCSDFRVVETLRWNGENLWDASNKFVMWVHNSLYFDMTTWNSHGFEIKRHGNCPLFRTIAILSCFRVSQGKMRSLLPLQVRCSFVRSMAQVQSIFGWYFQCLNELKFDIHNQSTVVKQSNKDNKGHVSWILYVRKRLGTFFFLDGESKINQDERGIEDKQEHRTVSLSYILRVHRGSCRKSSLQSLQSKCRWVKSQRKTWKSRLKVIEACS